MTASLTRSRFGRLSLNAAAAFARAASNSLAVVALPLILFGLLGRDEYASWAIAFTLCGYVLYFDAGVAPAVQTMVAERWAEGDQNGAQRAGLYGVQVLVLVSIGLLIAFLGIGALLPTIYPEVPESLHRQLRMSLLVLVVAQLCMLISNGVFAYFAGLQRQIGPAVLFVAGRVTAVVSATIVAFSGGSLVAIAVGFSWPAVVVVSILVAWLLRRGGEPSYSPGISRRHVLRLGLPLVFWTICGLVATGLGPLVVGRVDFEHLPAFSLAFSLALGVAGASQAILGPLLPDLAVAVKTNWASLPAYMAQAVPVGVLVSTFLGQSAAVVGMLAASIESVNGIETYCTVLLVCFSASLRQAVTPASFLLIATGRHVRVRVAPAVDALVAVALSVVLGALLGAIGVAVSMALSAAAAVAVTVLVVLRRAGLLAVVSRRSFFRSVVGGSVSWVPLLFAASMVVRNDGGSYALPLLVGWAMSSFVLALSCRPQFLRELTAVISPGMRRR